MTYRELVIEIMECYEDIMDSEAEILVNGVNSMCHITDGRLKSEAPELYFNAEKY